MTLQSYKILFIIVGLIGTSLFATPSLVLTVQWPTGEKFSEMWVLDSNHELDGFPFNVTAETTYTIFVGVANHMVSTSYYVVKVKFRNQTDPLPKSSLETQNSLPTLREYRVLIQNGEGWERQLTFSFSNVANFEDRSVVGTIKIDTVASKVDKQASWDSQNTGYYYQLLFELWIYNVETGVFQYHDRYCGIWMNMTQFSRT